MEQFSFITCSLRRHPEPGVGKNGIHFYIWIFSSFEAYLIALDFTLFPGDRAQGSLLMQCV